MRLALASIPLLFAIGCGDGPAGPLPIESGDVCAQCKMAISQKRFAAEMIDQGGNLHKFDDIGCMRRFLQEGGRMRAAESLFVADYDTAQWLDSRRAFYVRSASIQSPMASGLLAVGDRGRAEKHSRRFQGQLLTYAEVFR